MVITQTSLLTIRFNPPQHLQYQGFLQKLRTYEDDNMKPHHTCNASHHIYIHLLTRTYLIITKFIIIFIILTVMALRFTPTTYITSTI